MALLCRLDVTVGTAVTDFSNLKVVGVIRYQDGKGQVAAFESQRRGGRGYHNGQQSQSRDQNSLTLQTCGIG